MKNDNWFRKKIAGYRWCLLIVFGIILISAGMLLAYRHDNTFDIFVLYFFLRQDVYLLLFRYGLLQLTRCQNTPKTV